MGKEDKRYTPAGPNSNVRAAIIRNPKVAANVAMMHEKWLSNYFPSSVKKIESSQFSITTLKHTHRCTRAVARTINAQIFGESNEHNQISA